MTTAETRSALPTPIPPSPPANGRALRLLGPIAAGLALISAFTTFIVLADLTPIVPTHDIVVHAAAGQRIHRLPAARRYRAAKSGCDPGPAPRAAPPPACMCGSSACSRLSPRCPPILVAVVASITLDRGLDQLFSNRTRSVIQNSVVLADAYLREHAQSVRGDVLAMSFDVTRAQPLFDKDRDQFRKFLTAQAQVRGLSAALFIGPDLSVIERADLRSPNDLVMPSEEGLATVGEEEPQIGVRAGGQFRRRRCAAPRL